ncbi:hypothetical protein [Ruegeria sp.]|uniref:hypothetical protein n=1 Tax=Ruegeria sp. TaxID=1879320 RepID=UPI003C7D529E
MKYWESAEVEKSLDSSLRSSRLLLSPKIGEILTRGTLANLDWEFCYIPIVMGPDFIDLFPARTRLDRKEKKFFHSPQLSAGTFKTGNEKQKAAEYLRGILLATERLKSTILDDCQLAEFQSGIEALVTEYQN